jgi:AbrB family looped-hinge helix DNA binding protein
MKILGDSKVTEKFQATIPRVVRELLQLESGDRVVFLHEHDQILVKKGKLEVQV